jgi:two-component system, OmpR family, response regulator ResD
MADVRRVLVVDDESDIRLIVGLNVELAGMQFGQAANGTEAIEMLRTGEWDGCILDLAMPKTDGYTVLKELSDDGTLKKVAVVVLSARGTPQAAMEALEAGAHAHLTKPFSPGAVAKTIQELIEVTPEERDERRRRMLEHASSLDRLGMPTV